MYILTKVSIFNLSALRLIITLCSWILCLTMLTILLQHVDLRSQHQGNAGYVTGDGSDAIELSQLVASMSPMDFSSQVMERF